MVGSGRFVTLCQNPRRDIWENSLIILVNLSKHAALRPSLGNSGIVVRNVWENGRIILVDLSKQAALRPSLGNSGILIRNVWENSSSFLSNFSSM